MDESRGKASGEYGLTSGGIWAGFMASPRTLTFQVTVYKLYISPTTPLLSSNAQSPPACRNHLLIPLTRVQTKKRVCHTQQSWYCTVGTEQYSIRISVRALLSFKTLHVMFELGHGPCQNTRTVSRITRVPD